MRKCRWTLWFSILAVSLVTLVASAGFAQPGGGGGNGGGGNGGGNGGGGRRGGNAGGGQGNMASMVMNNLKPAPTDEEKKVIEPLLTKVTDLQMKLRGGAMGMFGRRNRGGEGDANAAAAPTPPPNPNALPEVTALQTVLADDNAKPEDIKAKMEAYRAAIKKVNDELKTAREELRKVLVPRQEAQLVLSGVLD